MSHDTIDALRRDIAALLPHAMHQAIASYERFALSEAREPEDTKEFAAHHAACKAALQHLETLVKLARWASADRAGARAAEEADLGEVVEEARRALARFPDLPDEPR